MPLVMHRYRLCCMWITLVILCNISLVPTVQAHSTKCKQPYLPVIIHLRVICAPKKNWHVVLATQIECSVCSDVIARVFRNIDSHSLSLYNMRKVLYSWNTNEDGIRKNYATLP